MAKKTIFIHQPDFLPWMGFFYRWAISDLFIMLDDVQFIRRGWHHRDKIKTKDGAAWLTVPVKKKGNYFQPINQVDILAGDEWKKNHLNLIHTSYKNAPGFKTVFPKIEAVYFESPPKLMDLNLNFLKLIADYLDIRTPFQFSSEFNLENKGSERLIELVKLAGGTDYITGTGSKAYIEENKFSRRNIRILWNEFSTPYYPQLFGDFMADLSILDAVMMLPRKNLQFLVTGDPVYAEMCA